MNTTDPKSFPEIENPNALIHYRPNIQKTRYHILISSRPSDSFSIPLLHVSAVAGLRRYRLALDALSAGVVILGLLTDAGGARVRCDGGLAGSVTLSVAGGVVGAKALLLGLLLLELVAGTGAAAGESVSVVFHVGRYSLGWRDVRCLGEGRHILSSRSCGGCWLVGWLINRIYLICVARCFAYDECTSSIF